MTEGKTEAGVIIVEEPSDLVTPAEPSWETQVWDRHQGKCANCGSEDRLRSRMIVPESAGGKMVSSNGVLLCRTCIMASDSASTRSAGNRRPVNFWVSRELYDRLNNGLRSRNGFSSMGQMIRYLMSRYVRDPGWFDDLFQYQDSRSPEVKINVWVDSDQYKTFKGMVDREGHTVTDTLKALIRMYECSGLNRLHKGE